MQILICRADDELPFGKLTGGIGGGSAPIFNRTRRRVRRGRGLFCGREPVDQSKKGFLADLPPGNRLRFQANLRRMY